MAKRVWTKKIAQQCRIMLALQAEAFAVAIFLAK
jgi:hypothetical protein